MTVQRWSVLLASLFVASVVSAQSPPSAFAALSGEWTGEGSLFGRPARFTMQWREENGFAVLNFTNGWLDSLGTVTPVLRAAALYRTDPAKAEGVWLDSRGARVELAWEASDSALVVTWTAPTETGRTTYRIRPSGDVEVTDEVRSGDGWRRFGTAVYGGRRSAFAGVPQAEVLLLGTFHFADPGRDDYKPRFPWNPLETHHQREIAEVVRLLAAFRPTRVALEWPSGRQAALDSAYDAFRSGRVSLGVDEREQLGFRLAHELDHERVYAVDAPGRSYDPNMTQGEYQRSVARLSAGADARLLARQQDLDQRFGALHQADDSLKTTMPLRDYLLRENDPDRILAGHGQYLIGTFHLGRDDDYFGPDMRTRWYNRNLRIFHTIQRIAASPEERILVIIGSGHLPILRHAVQASPEYRLVEVREVLERR